MLAWMAVRYASMASDAAPMLRRVFPVENMKVGGYSLCVPRVGELLMVGELLGVLPRLACTTAETCPSRAISSVHDFRLCAALVPSPICHSM